MVAKRFALASDLWDVVRGRARVVRDEEEEPEFLRGLFAEDEISGHEIERAFREEEPISGQEPSLDLSEEIWPPERPPVLEETEELTGMSTREWALAKVRPANLSPIEFRKQCRYHPHRTLETTQTIAQDLGLVLYHNRGSYKQENLKTHHREIWDLSLRYVQQVFDYQFATVSYMLDEQSQRDNDAKFGRDKQRESVKQLVGLLDGKPGLEKILQEFVEKSVDANIESWLQVYLFHNDRPEQIKLLRQQPNYLHLPEAYLTQAATHARRLAVRTDKQLNAEDRNLPVSARAEKYFTQFVESGLEMLCLEKRILEFAKRIARPVKPVEGAVYYRDNAEQRSFRREAWEQVRLLNSIEGLAQSIVDGVAGQTNNDAAQRLQNIRDLAKPMAEIFKKLARRGQQAIRSGSTVTPSDSMHSVEYIESLFTKEDGLFTRYEKAAATISGLCQQAQAMDAPQKRGLFAFR